MIQSIETHTQEMAVSMLPGALTQAEFEARMDEFRYYMYLLACLLG
jgi:hypothetical protein